MKPIAVIYATREGHTRLIAEHVTGALRARGFPAESVDAAYLPDAFSLDDYSAAVIAASVHLARHEREIVAFVKKNRPALEQIPAAFLSVSLSEAGAENQAAPPERRAEAAADVDRMIADFLAETGWHPSRIKAVAGALLYTRYNFLLRFIMKRIATRAGGGTDVSKDYDYTDWASLDEFVDQLGRTLSASA